MEIVNKNVYNGVESYFNSLYTRKPGGKIMLFRKHIEPRCCYCRFSAPAETGQYICSKRGIVPQAHSCRKFRYAPLRRVPPKPLHVDFTKYDDQDYSL